MIAPRTEEEKENEESYWQNELRSLGIECKRNNELNDKEELKGLVTAIKEVYFQSYKAVYNRRTHAEIENSHFEQLI